jgi:hypothetical protein
LKNALFSRNPWQLGASLWQIVLFIIFVYVPGVQQAFGTRPLPIQLIVTVIPFFVLVFVYDEARKGLIRWSGPNGLKQNFEFFTSPFQWLTGLFLMKDSLHDFSIISHESSEHFIKLSLTCSINWTVFDPLFIGKTFAFE